MATAITAAKILRTRMNLLSPLGFFFFKVVHKTFNFKGSKYGVNVKKKF